MNSSRHLAGGHHEPPPPPPPPPPTEPPVPPEEDDMLLDIAEEKDENALSKECELPAIHRIGIDVPAN